MDAKEIIKSLCLECGGQTKLAKKLGVSQPTVNGWLHGRQKPGPYAAVRIENATGGRWTRYDLRDDADELWPRTETSIGQ